MHPQPIELVDNCTTCQLRSAHFFCEFASETVRAFDAMTTKILYPRGATIFVEGQAPRGVFVLCQGRIKLSNCSSDGKTMILGIVEPGEALGLNATVSNAPYGVTAEALEPCQTNFVRRRDFLSLLDDDKNVSLHLTTHLNRHYQLAYALIRSLGLSQSVGEKLARLLLNWSTMNGEEARNGSRFIRIVTHEEIARMIGTTRETVSRTFSYLAFKEIIGVSGTTLTIRDRAALEALAGS